MNTPKLWSSIYANFAVSKAMSDAELATIRVFLKRSQAVPLTIFIRMDIEGAYTPVELIPLLASCSTRWETVRMDDVPISFIDDTSLLAGPFPALQNLLLRHSVDDIDPFSSLSLAKVQTLVDAQHLRIFQLESWDINFDALHLPWSQLTTVELRAWPDADNPLTPANALEILDRCPQLEELSISLDASSNFPRRPLLTAHKLKRLILYPQIPDVYGILLDQLHLPLLHELTLHSDTRIRIECPMNFVIKLIQRSSCRLTSLNMGKITIPSASLLSLFVRTPYLEAFQVYDDLHQKILDVDVIRALCEVESDGRPKLLPVLRHFSAINIANTLTTPMADLIEVRLGYAHRCLQLVFLWFYLPLGDTVDQDTKERFRSPRDDLSHCDILAHWSEKAPGLEEEDLNI